MMRGLGNTADVYADEGCVRYILAIQSVETAGIGEV
jgi:hypothetical protein